MQGVMSSPSKTTSSWRSNPLTTLLIASFLLTVGNKAYEIVLPLMMYEITHSSVAMATMKTAELLPNLLFGIVIGVIVDRVKKKNWVLWMVGIQAILLFLIAFLFEERIIWMFLYYSLGFLLMTFNYGYFNAQISLTKMVVPSHVLTAANSKFMVIDMLVSVAGPALTGLLLMMGDLSNGIYVTAICYTFCFFFLLTLPVEEEINRKTENHFWKDLVIGTKAFAKNRSLWSMSIFVGLVNCTMTVSTTTVVFFAREDLQLSSSMVAIILCATGIGGLIGSLIMNQLRNRFGLGMVYGLAMVISGFGYLILFVTKNIWVLASILAIIGFAISMHAIMANTFRHEQTPMHLMGRISGITGTIFRSLMPITMYLSGWVITWWGTASVFLACAIWNFIVFLIYLRTHLWKIT